MEKNDKVSDNELTEIIERIARRLIRKEHKKQQYFKIVDASSPHGVYVYDKDKDLWLFCEEPLNNVFSNGFYVIYFDNTECSACRKYDNIWFPTVKKFKNAFPYTYTIILCGWFSNKCNSKNAAKLFDEHKIKASPTTLFIYIKNGNIVYEEKYEGVLDLKDLVYVLKTFKDRALKAEKGLPVIKPPIEASQVDGVLEALLSLLSLNTEEG